MYFPEDLEDTPFIKIVDNFPMKMQKGVLFMAKKYYFQLQLFTFSFVIFSK